MTESRKCSRCGVVLSPDAPGGHCLPCLLQLGLASDAETDPLGVPPSGSLTVESADAGTPNVLAEKPGDRIGHYKLLQQIGEGGCGVVYMAEQEEPVRRRVALKIIKLGMDTRNVIARFEAERQALAMMDHPNIAKVFDAGVVGSSADFPVGEQTGTAGGGRAGWKTGVTGRPYFVMELVRGVKITTYCDQQKLSTRQRLDLFIQVCQAVQHAHQKGIIHRDLKPSNILVTEQDGAPVPKIIDFGIAKATTDQRLTDKTLFTAFEQFIGTPAYMSPEQAGLGGLDIDTRSDIYSLGVVLYELLTGKPPFDAEKLARSALDEILRTIREQEPPRPSARLTTLTEQELTTVAQRRQTESAKLPNLVRGDLDWIVMKALDKDRRRRYETANGFARDLQRFLDNETVVARPPSNLYRFQKMVRRNKLAFAAGAGIAAALVVGLAVALWQSVEKTREYNRAVAAEQEAKSARATEAKARQQADEARTRAEANEKKAQTEAAKSRQVAQFLKEMLKGVGPSVALGRDTAIVREILDKTAERLGKELANQPEVEIQIRLTLAETYRELGLYKRSEEMSREALRLARLRPNEENEDAADSLTWLGKSLMSQGDLEGAEKHLREALTMNRKLLGEHFGVAASLGDLGIVLQRQKKLAEAETLLGEALTMIKKVMGSEHPQVASTLNNLALVFAEEGKLTEAESCYREALAMHRKLVGNDHPQTATKLLNLAGVLGEEGKLIEAESSYREGLAILRRLLGNEHPNLAHCLNEFGALLYKQGRLSEAEPMFREAVAIQRKLLGTEQSQVPSLLKEAATSLHNLAGVVYRQHKLAETEILLRELVVIERKRSGDASADLVDCLTKLGEVLVGEDKQTDAENTFCEALAMQRKLLGNENPEVAASLHDLAVVLANQNKLAEARSFAEEAVVLYRRNPDWDLNSQRDAFDDFGNVLVGQGNFADAEAIFSELLAILRKRTPDHTSMSGALGGLAFAMVAQKKFAEAEPVARECVEFRQKHSSNSWSAFSAELLLGESLLCQKKYADAEPVLLSGYNGMEQRKDKIPSGSDGEYRRQPRLKKALQLLVQLFEETGRPGQAAEWKQKLAEFEKAEVGKKPSGP